MVNAMDYETEERLTQTLDKIARLSEKRRYRRPLTGAAGIAGVSIAGTLGLLTALAPQGLVLNKPPHLLFAAFAVAVAFARSVGGQRAGWISAGLSALATFAIVHVPSTMNEVEWALAMFATVASVAGVRIGGSGSTRSTSTKPPADERLDRAKGLSERFAL
jgi:hypothetical protein